MGPLAWAGMSDAFGVSDAAREAASVCSDKLCPASDAKDCHIYMLDTSPAFRIISSH
jgi:hypothetical protein